MPKKAKGAPPWTKKKLFRYRRRKEEERLAMVAEELQVKKEGEAWARKNDKVLTQG